MALQNPSDKQDRDHLSSIRLTLSVPTDSTPSKPDFIQKTIEISEARANSDLSGVSWYLDALQAVIDYFIEHACNFYLTFQIITTSLHVMENSATLNFIINCVLPYFLYATFALRILHKLIEFFKNLNDDKPMKNLAMNAMSILASALAFTASSYAFPIIGVYMLCNFIVKIFTLLEVQEKLKVDKQIIENAVSHNNADGEVMWHTELVLRTYYYQDNLIAFERSKYGLMLDTINTICFLFMSTPFAELTIIGQFMSMAYATLEIYYRNFTSNQFKREIYDNSVSFYKQIQDAYANDLMKGNMLESDAKTQTILNQIIHVFSRLPKESYDAFDSDSSTHDGPQIPIPGIQVQFQR